MVEFNSRAEDGRIRGDLMGAQGAESDEAVKGKYRHKCQS